MLSQIKPLIALGFSVIWLKPRSKIPVESSWQSRPRKSFRELESLYDEGMNVGVRPGTHSKLMDGTFLGIIDCDLKSKEEAHLKELKKALQGIFPDWEHTPHVISGRNENSMHIYCKTKVAFPKRQLAESSHKIKALMPSKPISKMDQEALTKEEIKEGYRLAKAWEITFLGTGSQAVLPPSVHPDSGRTYKWSIPVNTLMDLVVFNLPDSKKLLNPLKAGAEGSEIKFVEWDLMDMVEAGVSDAMIRLITNGDGMAENYDSDRSRALFAAINALSGAGLSSDKILSILTDSDNDLSEKPLERGGGNRGKAARWIKTQLDKVNSERDAASDFDVLEEFEDPLTEDEKEQSPWIQRLDRNQFNKCKNTAKNKYMILREGMLPETLCYDEFAHQIIFKADPPWMSVDSPSIVGKELSNTDITECRIWFSRKWDIEAGEEELFKIMRVVAQEFSFHPIRDYLNGLKWDGKERLDNWLSTYMMAEEDGKKEYVQAVARKTLVGAVARIMNPGCEFQNMLVLEGLQGKGKSSVVKILGDPWAPATYINPGNKDTINNLQKCWIVEMAEMIPTTKDKIEEFKDFISKPEDRARLAFERKAETYKRQCIFIGTTNQNTYLQDETGNRRFWPVKINGLNRKALRKDRDQLWAEAVVRYKDNEPLYLENKAIEKMAIEVQSSRVSIDAWENRVREIVEIMKDEPFIMIEKVYAEIQGWGDASGISNFSIPDQKRVGKILRLMGYYCARKWVKGKKLSIWIKLPGYGRAGQAENEK